MIHIFTPITILTIAFPVLAIGQTLSPREVLIELKQGKNAKMSETMGSVIEKSKKNVEVCNNSQGNCRPDAPTLHQLAFEKICEGGRLHFGWRMAEELSNGADFIKRAKTLARARELTDCAIRYSDKHCLVVVPTVSATESEPNVETLSLCQVLFKAKGVGPPTECIEIVKISKNKSFINSILDEAPAMCRFGLRDFTAVITYRFPAHEASNIRTAVKEILAAKPFDLEIEQEHNDVVGVRSYLPSGVFKGWREWISIRASFYPEKRDTEVSIATNILVSKQNSTSRESWTPPSEQQEAMYVDTLKKEFEKRGFLIQSR